MQKLYDCHNVYQNEQFFTVQSYSKLFYTLLFAKVVVRKTEIILLCTCH